MAERRSNKALNGRRAGPAAVESEADPEGGARKGPSEPEAYPALQAELNERLVTLRAEFREIIVSYSVYVQGLMTQVGDALAESPIEVSDTELRSRIRELRQARDELESVDLKPNKGRRRDLKKIEKLIVRLSRAVASW